MGSKKRGIYFQKRWDCLGSKVAIYMRVAGLQKKEEKLGKQLREKRREEKRGEERRKGKDEAEAERGSANSLKGF